VKGDYKTTSSTTAMMAELGWPKLQHRCYDDKLVMIYRIRNNFIAISTAQYFHPLTLGGHDYGHRFHGGGVGCFHSGSQ
jgi:hypothetical protein